MLHRRRAAEDEEWLVGAEMDGDVLPTERANSATPPQKTRLPVKTAACANDGGADTAHRNRRILCGGGSTSLLSASLPSLICIPSVRLHNYRGFCPVLSFPAPSDAIYTLKLLPSPILAAHRPPRANPFIKQCLVGHQHCYGQPDSIERWHCRRKAVS